jgi:hypothetical protein
MESAIVCRGNSGTPKQSEKKGDIKLVVAQTESDIVIGLGYF